MILILAGRIKHLMIPTSLLGEDDNTNELSFYRRSIYNAAVPYILAFVGSLSNVIKLSVLFY